MNEKKLTSSQQVTFNIIGNFEPISLPEVLLTQNEFEFCYADSTIRSAVKALFEKELIRETVVDDEVLLELTNPPK